MRNKKNPTVIAVIPCLNEEHFIADIVNRAKKYVDMVIVIDDGSTDSTAMTASNAGAQVVSHPVSRGAGAATRSGFMKAMNDGAEIVVTLDGDGQHNPDEIPLLIEHAVTENADLVIGSRFNGADVRIKRYRRFGIDVITFLYNIGASVKITDSQSGFRAHSRKLLENIRITENGFGFSVQVIIQARNKGMKISSVPITCIYHEDGSTLNPVRHGLGVAFAVVKHRLLRS